MSRLPAGYVPWREGKKSREEDVCERKQPYYSTTSADQTQSCFSVSPEVDEMRSYPRCAVDESELFYVSKRVSTQTKKTPNRLHTAIHHSLLILKPAETQLTPSIQKSSINIFTTRYI